MQRGEKKQYTEHTFKLHILLNSILCPPQNFVYNIIFCSQRAHKAWCVCVCLCVQYSSKVRKFCNMLDFTFMMLTVRLYFPTINCCCCCGCWCCYFLCALAHILYSLSLCWYAKSLPFALHISFLVTCGRFLMLPKSISMFVYLFYIFEAWRRIREIQLCSVQYAKMPVEITTMPRNLRISTSLHYILWLFDPFIYCEKPKIGRTEERREKP